MHGETLKFVKHIMSAFTLHLETLITRKCYIIKSLCCFL